jgi:hypothetical protein
METTCDWSCTVQLQGSSSFQNTPPLDNLSLQAHPRSDFVSSLGSFWKSRFTLLSQTQPALSFTSSRSYIPQPQCSLWHSILCPLGSSHIYIQTSPIFFSYLFSLILIKSYVPKQRARKLSWPMKYINLFLCYKHELSLEVCLLPPPPATWIHDQIVHKA